MEKTRVGNLFAEDLDVKNGWFVSQWVRTRRKGDGKPCIGSGREKVSERLTQAEEMKITFIVADGE